MPGWDAPFFRQSLLRYFFFLTAPFVCSHVQIPIDLRKSLNDLKEKLVQSAKLGKFGVGELRLFYLGRELKNGGRSLENLGVGSLHDVNVIHVHPTRVASATWTAPPLPRRSPAAAGAPATDAMTRFLRPAPPPGGITIPVATGLLATAPLGRSSATDVAPYHVRQSVPSSGCVKTNDDTSNNDSEIIEIDDGDDDDVEVSDGATTSSRRTSASNGINLLESIQRAIGHHAAIAAASSTHNGNSNNDDNSNNNEIVNVENNDDDGDDCVVVGTLSARNAKRRRYE